jgi:hypothetical protein
MRRFEGENLAMDGFDLGKVTASVIVCDLLWPVSSFSECIQELGSFLDRPQTLLIVSERARTWQPFSRSDRAQKKQFALEKKGRFLRVALNRTNRKNTFRKHPT